MPREYIERARQRQPGPTINHGQRLMWSERADGTGMQGIIEQTKCERDDDEWLKSVQDEF